MRAAILARLREWYILAIGACVILAGLYVASVPSTPAGSAAPVPVEPSTQAPESQIASQNPAPASAQSPNAQPAEAMRPPAPLTTAAPSRPAAPSGSVAPQAPDHPPSPAQPAVTPAHTHAAMAAASPPSQTVAQAPSKPAAAAAIGGDATAGRQVYKKCQACHSLEPGKNALGPSLAGIVGKKSGEVPNYNYSAAMKAADIVWDAATLDAYLLDPQKVVPQNKMPFPGLKTANERKDVIAYLVAATSPEGAPAVAQRAQPPAAPPAQPAAPTTEQRAVGYVPDARYTLRSGIADGRMVYLGVGGTIDGQVNPVLSAAEGQIVQIILINGEGAEHDIVFPDQDVKSPRITGRGASTTIAFRATRAGDFAYLCSVPGHELAGMRGQFIVTPRPPAQVLVEADISQKSTEVPPPVGNRPPQTVRVDLNAVELEGRLAEGTTFGYWTFNGRVPGPMLRVRVGDTVDVRVKNSADSTMIHSVDFHAATGPGGGAAATQVDPGAEKSFKFKALIPGLYVYHCATPMVAHHIANGMYGLILVEPEGGLPAVDREFYVMQGEIYTEAPFGHRGSQEFSVEKLLNERPEYFVFNGAVGALSKLHPLEAKVGETVRIFFGVGGPNYTSSFHVIGEIFDRVYNLGGVLSEPLRGVQTVTVPAGGAVITEFKVDVPGNYILVDHALSRAERGLVGILHVEGSPNPEIFDGKVEAGGGH
jgi:nitrite reductase (NO-forming)